MINFYSFDIFDTVLSRTVYSPRGVFQILEKNLQNDEWISRADIKDSFAFLRIKSEKQARKDALAKGKTEIILDDIYDTFSRMTGCSDEEADYIKNKELDAEYAVSYGVKDNIDLIKNLIYEGKRVILISDMYLSEKEIRRLLRKTDSIFDDIPVYVSSEYGLRKKDGTLYEKVRETEKTRYDMWIHYGDNERSDYTVPKRLGINAVNKKLPGVNIIDNEKRPDCFDSRSLFFQLYYGIIRKILVEGRRADTGAEYAAPILLSYVNWIIRICKEKDINRLYFLSRDGYLLKMIADLVISENSNNITTKYIYGSRRVFRHDSGALHDIARRYLKQEIQLSDNRFAIVDTQSTGKSMGFVSRMLDRDSKTPLNVFYYVLNTETVAENCRNYVFTVGAPMDGGVVELLCRAPHGSVRQYSIDNDIVIPELYDTKEDFAYFNEYSDQIKRLVCEMETEYSGISVSGLTSHVVADYFTNKASSYQDKKMNDFLGDIPHSNTDTDGKYAPVINEDEAYQTYLAIQYPGLGITYKGSNIELSLNRSGSEIKRLIEDYTVREKNELVRYSGKVIIYGAGKIGRCLYSFLKKETSYSLAGWADANYKNLDDKRIKSIDDCMRDSYDVVVIAVVRNQDTIRETLLDRGIPDSRIMTYLDFVNDIVSDSI